MNEHFQHHLNEIITAAVDLGAAQQRLDDAQADVEIATEEVIDSVTELLRCFNPATVQ
jgi:hypothetical protein